MKFALPNSLAFVFTDASARDFHLYEAILPTIQKKQVKVSFLITGSCNNTDGHNESMYQVYHKLAAASEGQVFELSPDIVKEVLISISQALDPKFESLSSVSYDSAGATSTKIQVDQGFSTVSVNVAGENATLSVRDENNETISSKTSFSSPNIKFMTFEAKNPSYTIDASAQSGYTIHVGGMSDLKFKFGFSRDIPSDQSGTAVQPLVGFENVLSIFISDPKLVKCLTRATLIPASTTDSFEDIELKLKKIKNDFFATNSTSIPTKMFKIGINGYDKKGNVINRLISRGIESTEGSMLTHHQIIQKQS